MTIPGSERTRSCEVLVLGAGLGGLAAARGLGGNAIVLERNSRPGGLARSENVDGYQFDHAIHVLYFPDTATRDRIFELEGHHLAPLSPEAWVETAAGVARFPLQLHLGALDRQFTERCVRELERILDGPPPASPAHFEALLESSFGRELCELFFFPYNRKVWKRPLSELAPTGFQWNIVRPDLEQMLRGVREPGSTFRSYNSEAWYPRPPAGAPLRGIEVLSQALARGLDIRVGREVLTIDPERRMVTAIHDGVPEVYCYERACIGTLPLPELTRRCVGFPFDLAEACSTLERNRVVSVALAVRGPRPVGTGHWRYYPDESLAFNRLIWPHVFDPLAAPPEGWVLLAEITEPSSSTPLADAEWSRRVRADATRVGALPPDADLFWSQVHVLDPAYVVFRVGESSIVERARAALEERGIRTVGRYGRWEYSSMAQVMRDGFAEAGRLVAEGHARGDATGRAS